MWGTAGGGKGEARGRLEAAAFKRKMDSDPLLCMPSLPGTQLINYSQTFGVMARDEGDGTPPTPTPSACAENISKVRDGDWLVWRTSLVAQWL